MLKLPKFTFEQAAEVASQLVDLFPVEGWKVGSGDFNKNGTPDVILEVFFDGRSKPFRFILDVPGLDIKEGIKNAAKLFGPS